MEGQRPPRSETEVIVGLDPPNPMLNQYISLALAHRVEACKSTIFGLYLWHTGIIT